ncbi:hypothetical protein DID76_01410 [Candidatus Marinamargulisbacteria bacterium SCGC AG-414-C22]|nr:hypothetical protein DID76_01410 [Candidatus Marinamargulisbacteria bacterium SCGC AG-414-C22]
MLDVIIVGQGIAGSTLAYKCMQQGYRIKIISSPDKSATSLVAAGLMQAVTGLFLTVSQQNIKYLTTAVKFYQSLEQVFNTTFITPHTCYRYLNPIQIKKWEKKRYQTLAKEYIGEHFVPSPAGINPALKFIHTFPTYCVQPERLLDRLTSYFKHESVLLNNTFTEKNICIKKDHISYDGIKARYIILCLGHHSASSSLYESYSFDNVKGETMTINNLDQNYSDVYQGRQWMVPFAKNVYRIGATYSRNNKLEPTEEGLSVLTQFLTTLAIKKFSIKQHNAGIRCVLNNGIPLVESLPSHPRLLSFTGFGSKGFMTCPWYADRLIRNLAQVMKK